MNGNMLVLPTNDDQFSQVQVDDLSSEEQVSLINLALNILSNRHRPGELIDKPAASVDYLRLRLADSKREVFGVIFMNQRHRIIADETLFFGSLASASVYPREVVRRALEVNAGAVIFYHNHPSGDPSISHADKQLTKRLVEALKLIDVRTLDHIVVGYEGFESFAEKGLL